MLPPNLDKETTTALAKCALLGIVATPSCDERGRRTIVLSRGAWTKETLPEGLAQALEEAKALAG